MFNSVFQKSTSKNMTSPTEKWLVGGILSLLSYSAWARGGTVMPLQALLPWIGLLLIIGLFIVSWVYRSDEQSIFGFRLVKKYLKIQFSILA